MMMVRITCLIVLFIASCKESKQAHDKNKQLKFFNDTIKKDIPKWYNEDTLLYLRGKEGEKRLGLFSIENGFDGLQIRFWVECSSDTQNLIIITNYRDKWEASFYSYNMDLDESGKIISLKSTIEKKAPISGWEKFSIGLLSTGIKELQDYQVYKPDYTYPNDANAITVEVATPTVYRIYQYPALGLNKKIKDGPAKLDEAILLIEREFSYQRACD